MNILPTYSGPLGHQPDPPVLLQTRELDEEEGGGSCQEAEDGPRGACIQGHEDEGASAGVLVQEAGGRIRIRIRQDSIWRNSDGQPAEESKTC